MERIAWRVTLLSLFLISSVFCRSRNAGREGADRRQLYLGEPPGELPTEYNSDIPAPIVLPSGVVPDAGVVPPAGAIAPAPLIPPAPAILPSNAIKEKDRAYPAAEGKTKRFQFPFSTSNQVSPQQWGGQLPQEPVTSQSSMPFYENQMPQSPEASMFGQQNPLMPSQTVPIATNEMFDDATNRDQLSSTSLSMLQGQFASHNSPPTADKVEYFEPNESQETPPYLDSKQFPNNGPTKEDLKAIQPLLESENDITNAIIRDSWSEDTKLSSSRQAVSEGLATSHQLANVEWKNKPVVQEKPSKQPNQNNFLLDQVHAGALHKQEFSPPHLQEEVSMADEQNHKQELSPPHLQEAETMTVEQNHKQELSPPHLQEAVSVTDEQNHKQELSPPHSQEAVSMAGELNHKAASLTTNNASTDSLSATMKISTKLRDHSSVSSKPNVTSSMVENDSVKKNISDSDSHNEWFTNTSLLMGNSTISPNHRSTLKPYTAADYLKNLYPQLSVFKAPFEIDEKNPSSAKDSVKSSPLPLHSSFLLRNGTFRKKTSPASINKLTANYDDPESNKLSPEMQREVQEALLMSLLKSPSNLGARSTVKQILSKPRYISSASNLLMARSKKPGMHEPGHKYLTGAGAKLLPAHIFSPLGSEFKDPVEPSVPFTTSPSSPVQTTSPPQSKVKIHPIEPTQIGYIHAGTQSSAGKESSTVPAFVPTQSGFIPGLSPTKNPYAQTQSGFIPTSSGPPKEILPTVKPFSVQSGFISSNTEKQGNKMWLKAHNVDEGSERNKPKTTTIKHRLSSHEAQMTYNDQQKPGMSRLHENAKQGNGNQSSKPRVSLSHIADSSPTHSRQRRQMFLPAPLMQANDNPQQFGQSLLSLPGQLPGQQLLSNLPQLQQPLQQFLPAQQFLPTQPLQSLLPQFVSAPQALDPLQLLGQPDQRSQFPLQQTLNNQIPQNVFTPQELLDSGGPFGGAPQLSVNQLSKTLGLTPLQHILPQRMSPNGPGYPQNGPLSSFGQTDMSPERVNVPMMAPQKIPSFLTASQVYKDFEDVNTRSHLSDDIFGNQMSQGDVGRNDFTPEDDRLPDEPRYDKFAYENDKKLWGYNEDEGVDGFRDQTRKERRLHYTSDDMDEGKSIVEPKDIDESQSSSNLRYGTEGRRHHRPRPRHRHHWVNEDTLQRLNGKGIIGHNEGIDEEINDEGIHPADDTTENAIKDSYETPHHKSHRSSKHVRPSSDDENVETNQSEKSSSNEDTENDQPAENTEARQLETGVSDGDNDTEQPETDASDDSEQDTHAETTSSDDKSEKNEELKDGLEEPTSEESPGVSTSTASISLPKPATGPSSTTMREKIIKKLSRSAVMHLSFDSLPVKHGDNKVQDQSGNKNDAGLANGAEISNRTMGSCGRVADLKHGEVMYKADQFTRKPTKAASIAMWVKSRKPGLVRWFDVDDGAGSPSKDSVKKLVKVPKNQWIHLAGTFDSKDGIARVYVNGKLISETVGKKNKGLPDDFTATGIGQKFGDKFISFLDDVFMFDRVISPAEVRVLYKKCEFNRMVLHFGFQKVNTTTHQVMDQSGLENNATLDGGAHILTSGCDKCGACLDASNDKMPSVFLDGRKFHHKPTSAISIASWISLNHTKGRHSIFQAVGNKNDEWHDIYNLEVVNGKLHWRHKTANGGVTFDVKTDDVAIPEGLWSHVTATYNSESGDAKIYVNGLLKGSFNNPHKSKLSDAWGRVLIGGHLPDGKKFAGLLDEFFIYNWELDPSEVHFVLKYCADKPKLVSFTVRVPLFKRQKVQSAPTALKYL
ncbi:uncharacterized protein LOC144643627 isoform X2 [Oculina patagonica]